MIEIMSNGSRLHGEPKATLEDLLDVLRTHTLDPSFEGQFYQGLGVEGLTMFRGNFLDVSHVFSVMTNEIRATEALRSAILRNRKTAAYQREIKARVEARVAAILARQRTVNLAGKTFALETGPDPMAMAYKLREIGGKGRVYGLRRIEPNMNELCIVSVLDAPTARVSDVWARIRDDFGRLSVIEN